MKINDSTRSKLSEAPSFSASTRGGASSLNVESDRAERGERATHYK